MLRLLWLISIRRIKKDLVRSLLLILVLFLTCTLAVSVAGTGRLSVASIQRLSGLTQNINEIVIIPKKSNLKQSDFSWLFEILPSEILYEIHNEPKRENFLQKILLKIPSEIDTEGLAQSLRLRIPYQEYSYEVISASFVAKQATQITQSFRSNIQLLVLLTIGVCLFILFTSAGLTATQLQSQFAILRSLGVKPKVITLSFLLEGIILGTIGGLLGVTLGKNLTLLFTAGIQKTIASQYSLGVTVDGTPTLKETIIGFTLVLLVSLLGYLFASWQVYKINTIQLLRKTSDRAIKLKNLIYIFIFLVFVFFISLKININQFLGSILIFFLSGIPASILFYWLISILTNNLLISKISLLLKQLSKSVNLAFLVSVSASAVALTLLIGMTLFIYSFEKNLFVWADKILTAQVFVQADRENPISMDLFNQLKNDQNIKELMPSFYVLEQINNKLTVIGGVNFNSQTSGSIYPILKGNFDAHKMVNKNYVMISEPALNKLKINIGSKIIIRGVSFEVLAVYQDFSRDSGTILMHFDTLQNLTQTYKIDTLSIHLKDLNLINDYISSLESLGLKAQSQTQLMQDIKNIFDQTFMVTKVLSLLLLIVCAVGALLNFLQKFWEEKESILVVKILGINNMNLMIAFVLQAFIVSLACIFSSLVGGGILGWYICQVINPMAFGWSIVFSWSTKALFLPVISLITLLVISAILSSLISASKESLKVYD